MNELQLLQKQVSELQTKMDMIVKADRIVLDKTAIYIRNDILGFFRTEPIKKWSSATGRQDISVNDGVAANVGFRVDGNTGTTYYSLGDVVAALKAYGLLAN